MENKNCAVEGCTNPIQAKNMCAAHYQRQRQGKDIIAPMRRRKSRFSENQLDIFPVDPTELN